MYQHNVSVIETKMLSREFVILMYNTVLVVDLSSKFRKFSVEDLPMSTGEADLSSNTWMYVGEADLSSNS